MGSMVRIGHRGATEHAPENTLGSVGSANSLGVDLVEMDVQRKSDGYLLIIHDIRVETPAVADYQWLTNEAISLLQSASKLKRTRECVNTH
jgi:glycerophosphoryl diester phosphodiesterase